MTACERTAARGRIIEGRGGLYTARGADGQTHVLRAKKKLRRQNLSPLVGDDILFTPGAGQEHGWVEEILPRSSVCLRPPVANITLLALVIAPAPQPDWLLLDKLLLGARMQGMRAVILANKCDLGDAVAEAARQDYRGADVAVLPVSAATGAGVSLLKERMRGDTVCFAGQSGVGKSTLINALLGLSLETGDMSRIARGRHTTRYAQLIERDGLCVLDTPGFSLLEADKLLEPSQLMAYYPEFAPYLGQCRFQPCFHGNEPGCAVQAAADAGCVSAPRLARYRALLASTREAWKNRYD